MDQIICGDCLAELPNIPDNTIDLILTDPPYYRVKNLPWDRQWDSPDGFLAWMDRVLEQFQRVLKPNGSLYVFASPRMAARVEVLTAARFNVLNHIVWTKPQGRSNQASKEALRSFFPESERVIFAEPIEASDAYHKANGGLRATLFEPIRAYIVNEFERAGVSAREVARRLCVTPTMVSQHYLSRSQWHMPTPAAYAKMRAALNGQGDTEYLRREYEDLRREYEDLRAQYETLRRPFNATPDRPYTDVWIYPTVTHYPGKHACEKPQPLLRHIIQTSTRPNATVLDAFAGSGSTLQVARDLGRHYIGIEIDPEWARKARQRLANAQPSAFAEAAD